MASEKVVSVVLRARVEGFTAGMSKAKKSVDDLTKAAAPSKADAFGKLADKAALAGVGVATAVGVAVKRFADFDQAMSAVQANSGATGKTLDSLRDAAVRMGADSQFSATEAAQGINAMAKAGVEARDILGGGLKGALDLAAAGQISVADAAETAATAMTQFGLTGDKVPHIADLLANAANKAQGGVGDMAQALNQAGLVAKSMGLSIEETTAGLTAFASAGLLGSDAGTSFKTMLQRLSAPQGKAAEEMAKLNINAFDAQGEFVGLANVAEQLKTGMQDLTPAQRAASLAIIFGSDSVRAANVLYEQGAAGINKWTQEVNEQGTAAKQAAALTDNLKGDIERLGGALDSALIQTGSSANGSLRGLVQGLTGLVGAVANIPGPVLLAGGALASFALLAPKGVLKYREYVSQLDSLGLSLDKISAKAPRTGKALEGVGRAGKGLAIAAVAAGTLDEAFGKAGSGAGVQVLTQKLLDSDDAVAAFSKNVDQFAKSQSNWWNTDQVRDFSDVLHAAFDPSVGQDIDKVAGSLTGISTDVSNANARMKELDAVLSALTQGGQTDAANALFEQFASAAKDSGVSVDELKTKLPQYVEALAGVSGAAATTAAGQGELTDATGDLEQSADDAKKALDDLRSAIEGLGSPLAAQRAAERDYQAAIDASADRLKKRADLQKELAEAKATPLDTDSKGNVVKGAEERKADAIARITAELAQYTKGFDVNTAAGRANQEALDGIRDATLKNVTATFDSINATKGTAAATDAATAAMARGRDAFIKAAVAAGMTKDAAGKLADQLGLVPKDVKIQVSQSGAAAAEEAIDKAARDRTAIITVQRRIADFKAEQEDKANAIRRADGGRIPGYSPHARADNILVAATAGEFMIRKAAADSLGKATLDYLNRYGRLPERRADGGAIAGQFAPMRLAPSLSGSRSASDGMGRQFVSGSLDMGDGLVGFIRAVVADERTKSAREQGLVAL